MNRSINRKNLDIIAALALAFFLSGLCFLIAFFLNDIGLFGQKTILISDMKKQYIAFYSALRDGRLGFYSQEIGLGTPTIGLIAYYLSSPFSLLVFLFPIDRLPTALFFILLIKAACSAVTFCCFLISKKELKPMQCVPFSICYSLMSFVFFFFINQFWFDALIWLPLLILSLEHIIEDRKISMTSIVLAVLFISNYYISYMTGLFAALYCFYLCFYRRKTFKETAAAMVRLAVSAALALLVSAFLLAPTLYEMVHSLGDTFDGYKTVNYTPKQLILKLFIGYFDSIGNVAAPTVFCGTLVLLLVVLFFINPRFSLRERIGNAVLLGFLLVSTYLPFLDKIWHGFAFPNGFAYRYAFCISFLLVTIAARSFARLSEIKRGLLLVFLMVPLIMLVFSVKMLRNVSTLTYVGEITFFICYPLLLFLREKMPVKKAFTALTVFLVCFEMTLNGAAVLHGVDVQNEFPLYSQYTDYCAMMHEAIAEADTDVRIAYIDDERLNAGMEIGFRSPSLFSSAYDPLTAEAVSKLGYASSFKQYRYVSGYQETDRLFGIGYRLTANKEGSGESPVVTGVSIETLEEPLPTCFVIPVDMVGTALLPSPEENQALVHDFLGAAAVDSVSIIELSGSHILISVEADEDSAVWMSIPAQEGWHAEVDGRDAAVQKTLDYFISVFVPEGTHVVECRYTPPLLKTGCMLSAAGVLLTVGVYLLERKKTQASAHQVL